jgi:hypothetical protein
LQLHEHRYFCFALAHAHNGEDRCRKTQSLHLQSSQEKKKKRTKEKKKQKNKDLANHPIWHKKKKQKLIGLRKPLLNSHLIRPHFLSQTEESKWGRYRFRIDITPYKTPSTSKTKGIP